jgi:hypothetical protein
LNDADVVAVLIQTVVDAFPTRAVNKAAVNEDDATGDAESLAMTLLPSRLLRANDAHLEFAGFYLPDFDVAD